MTNIWQSLKKPIICLAPMDGVTDLSFRQLLVGIGKPDLMFTEFINIKAIYSHDRTSAQQRLDYTDQEKPLIAQIWGITPELFYKATKLIADLGFDGVDLNFGCPDKHVIKNGAGSAMINDHSLATEIIEATKEGAKGKIPVSIKTRIGFKSIDTENWISFLLKFNLDALTIHGRTTKEMFKVPNHWDEVGKAVKLKNKLSPNTLIIGNGDIFDLKTAHQLIKKHQLDGIMIGRGVFHDPYIFNPNQTLSDKSPQEKIDLLLKHLSIFHQTWGDTKNFAILKRYFKIYLNNFNQAAKLRDKLMATNSKSEAENTLRKYK